LNVFNTPIKQLSHSRSYFILILFLNWSCPY
jgi:hypothetical protein